MTEQEWLASTDPVVMLSFLTRRNAAPAGHATVPAQYPSDRKLRLFAVACCRQVWEGKKCAACDGDGLSTGPPECRPCRRCSGTGKVGDLTDARSRRAVEVAEKYADGEASAAEVTAAQDAADALRREQRDGWEFDNELAYRCLGGVRMLTENAGLPRWFSVSTKLRAVQADLLREVFGNPFRPLRFCECDPEFGIINCILRPCRGLPCHWCDMVRGRVYSLARVAYDDRDPATGHLSPARLAVLADALEEAGCREEALLRHLRARPDEPSGCPRCEWTGRLQIPALPRGWQYCPHCSQCPTGPHVRGCWAVDLLLGRE